MTATRDATVAIIQARIGSTRLPGKVLKRLQGRSVLAHVIERVRAAQGVDEIIVATSTKVEDDVIVAETVANRATPFRGSESDVLARYFGAAAQSNAGTFIRVTSDCPFYDPSLLTHMLAIWKQKRSDGRQLDYLSNTIKRSYPRGLDTEIFTFEALERANRDATAPEEREHVTVHFYRHPETFALDQVESPVDLSRLRWTLDTEDDWRFVSEVYARLYCPGAVFSTADVLGLLQREPALGQINAHVEQKDMKAH